MAKVAKKDSSESGLEKKLTIIYVMTLSLDNFHIYLIIFMWKCLVSWDVDPFFRDNRLEQSF